ncbi:hypothetical protein [uncultured Shewanella sp.]|uniref:hypothetical protein n=1 Tax=uncultured Shewanella sp. TaxID=173975 RepID=UPI0026264328|nr:hypothetical protein [uncultured Shewanella sp.]
MAALSKEQGSLLNWIGQGNSIAVCIELCPDLGKVIRGKRYNQAHEEHFQRRTLFKLKALGFIKEEIHYITGMRYLICTISQRGLERLEHAVTRSNRESHHA